MELDQGVYDGHTGRLTLSDGAEVGRDAIRDDGSVEEGHYVEGDTENRLVLADCQDFRHRNSLLPHQLLDPRFTHHVMGRPGKRRARAAPQHKHLTAALEAVGDIGLPVADSGPGKGPSA